MSMNNPENENRLRQLFPFLQEADSDFCRAFFDSVILAHLKTGNEVCAEGNTCTHLPLLVEGVARIYKSGETGKEITLYRIRPGESCVLTASCILSGRPFPATANVESNLTAALVPAEFVRKWIGRDSAWRAYIFSLVADRLSAIIQVVEEVVFQRLDQRVAAYLLRHGSGSPAAIHATHQEIADELGTSREVVSRLLKSFEQSGAIRLSRGQVTVVDSDYLLGVGTNGL